MTLGHVIIGRDARLPRPAATTSRPTSGRSSAGAAAFIPAYLLASVWAWSRGRHYYLDNWFERDARRALRRGRW